MIRKIFSLTMIGAGLVVTTALTLQAATELARINAKVISLEEFNKKYQDNLKFFPAKAPTRKAVLDDLIKRELAIQEARKLGLDKDPEVTDRMNTVLYHALLDRKLGKELESMSIPDSEAKAHYQRNPEIRTSHIFISVAPGASAEAERDAMKKIRDIQARLRKGDASFAQIAQEFSEGPAAPVGGDLDYQSREKLDPAYYEAAKKLGVGKVSEIVRSQFGFHLIRLTAVRSWEETDKSMVKRQVMEERRSQLFERYMGQLRAQSKVSVKSELLKD